MENLKKNPLSLQLNVEDFAPASNDEKKSLVVMRESVNFWKDGMRRLVIVRQRKARSRGEHVQEHHESPADGFPDARQPAGIRAEKA